MPNKEGRWVTINGRAIFIGEGQSLEEALNSKGQVKKTAGKTGASSSAGKKTSESDIPQKYRGIYKIGKDDPDSYKTGDTVDGMKILASLDPKRDGDDEHPYAYLTDSKEHPVVTIVHDRVYDVDIGSQAGGSADLEGLLSDPNVGLPISQDAKDRLDAMSADDLKKVKQRLKKVIAGTASHNDLMKLDDILRPRHATRDNWFDTPIGRAAWRSAGSNRYH